MQYSYMRIFIAIICLLINAITQVFSFRHIARKGLLGSVYLGVIFGLAALFIYEFYDFSIAGSLTNLLIYCSLGYCYFHFINLGETARRIRIIRELYESPEGLSAAEILQRYNAKEIIQKRINRLISNGQIIFKEGKYYIGGKTMFLITKIMVFMKIAILGKKSEFA